MIGNVYRGVGTGPWSDVIYLIVLSDTECWRMLSNKETRYTSMHYVGKHLDNERIFQRIA